MTWVRQEQTKDSSSLFTREKHEATFLLLALVPITIALRLAHGVGVVWALSEGLRDVPGGPLPTGARDMVMPHKSRHVPSSKCSLAGEPGSHGRSWHRTPGPVCVWARG